MKMSEPLHATFWQETELPLMSSQAGSRAKTLALLESKRGLTAAQDPASGPKSCDLLASYDRATSSWRTSQTCLVALAANEAGGLAEYSETWPRSGMMRNGTAFRLPMLAPAISEIEHGYWPTPCASDNKSRKVPKRPHVTKNGTLRHLNAEGVQSQVRLSQAVKFFPTPNASDNRNRGGPKDACVQRRQNIGKQVGLSMTVDGELNPMWVEWLMGFPMGWTDLED